MKNTSTIKWRRFKPSLLGKRKFEVVLLLKTYVENAKPHIFTDLWTGDCLLNYQEHRVDYFCPLNEINMPSGCGGSSES